MIRVCFFGRFSDLAGDDGWQMESTGIAAVADVVAHVARRDSALHAEITGPQVLFAVNQEVVPIDARVSDGDEVAFLPPVTGG